MIKREDLVYKDTNSKFTSIPSFQIPKEVVIETNHIAILHKDLGLKIDINTEQIKELHRITINGVSFVREQSTK